MWGIVMLTTCGSSMSGWSAGSVDIRCLLGLVSVLADGGWQVGRRRVAAAWAAIAAAVVACGDAEGAGGCTCMARDGAGRCGMGCAGGRVLAEPAVGARVVVSLV